ncbi:MAG: CapA family protein [Polyangia bacterium]|jgi:poly-gamma-glutamate synthesis protein (capsule biosynthesis protein)|nr:CapA family protein [Polyangia bacterium]
MLERSGTRTLTVGLLALGLALALGAGPGPAPAAPAGGAARPEGVKTRKARPGFLTARERARLQKEEWEKAARGEHPKSQPQEVPGDGPSATMPPMAPGAAIRFVLTGDVALNWRGTSTDLRIFHWRRNPLRFFAPVFKAADLAVANMETVLADQDPKYAQERLNLWAPVASGQIFRPAGIGLLTTANNHAFDARDRGVLETLGHLRRTGVEVMGTGATLAEARRPYTFLKGPSCVAFVPGTTKCNLPVRGKAHLAFYPEKREGELIALVKETKERCAFVIVVIHWGVEMKHFPHPSMKRLAHELVDAGADLVVGHHPHVLQGVEYRGKGAIVYSLGNFVFSNPNEATRRTGALVVELSGGAKPSLVRLSMIPAYIHRNDYIVRPAAPSRAADIQRRMASYSQPFGTQVVLTGGVLQFTRGKPED